MIAKVISNDGELYEVMQPTTIRIDMGDKILECSIDDLKKHGLRPYSDLNGDLCPGLEAWMIWGKGAKERWDSLQKALENKGWEVEIGCQDMRVSKGDFSMVVWDYLIMNHDKETIMMYIKEQYSIGGKISNIWP